MVIDGTDPKLNVHAEQNFWDELWETRPRPKYPRDEVVRFFFRRYPERAARSAVRVLDLGCGGGVHTLFLAEEGFDVASTDFSPLAVSLTRQRLAEQGLSADTTVASLEALPFRPQSFDIILSVRVLDCAFPGLPEAAMPSIAKLLRPKGAGLFIFASDADYSVADPTNPFVRKGFTEAEVVAMFGAAFQIVEINRHVATERNRTIELNEWMVTASVPVEH